MSHTRAKEQTVKPRVIVIALLLASAVHVGASVRETLAPAASEPIAQSQLTAETTVTQSANQPSGRLPTVAPDRLMPAFVASTPFANLEVASLPREISSLPREIASLPRDVDALSQHESQDANVAPPPPTPTPTSDRPGCDPAYPDDRTCIPPGPPFDQGCAITGERRFTVLPPDPQGLDHDHDGIGCEPIR
jgi:hypothetical protein